MASAGSFLRQVQQVASAIAWLRQKFTGRNSGFGMAKDTDDLLLGKKLLHGDVLTWQMKTLLTSRCVNQRGEGQPFKVDTKV
jgi:mannose-6-phosphate isomerase